MSCVWTLPISSPSSSCHASCLHTSRQAQRQDTSYVQYGEDYYIIFFRDALHVDHLPYILAYSISSASLQRLYFRWPLQTISHVAH